MISGAIRAAQNRSIKTSVESDLAPKIGILAPNSFGDFTKAVNPVDPTGAST